MHDSRRFYKELGNLFYAIAVADHTISPKEKKILDDEVQYSWKHFDHTTDRFGSDRAFLIEFEFETMEDSMETPENAFASFAAFFKENEREFDEHLRKKIFNSARHIAESVRMINKRELDYLVKLKTLLKI